MEGLDISDEAVRMLMLDREAWRVRLNLMLLVTEEVNKQLVDKSKIRRDKTRKATVIV